MIRTWLVILLFYAKVLTHTSTYYYTDRARRMQRTGPAQTTERTTQQPQHAAKEKDSTMNHDRNSIINGMTHDRAMRKRPKMATYYRLYVPPLYYYALPGTI